jgi:hypothetical protein
VPLLVNEFASDFCQSVLTLGTGSQTRVVPIGFAMSTRVVTSKVRQSPGLGEKLRVAGVGETWADAEYQGANESAPMDAAP